jgi:hypothetical protein
MPNAKDNVKMSGDTHLPESESDLPLEEGSTAALGTDGKPSVRVVKKAGLLRDPEVAGGSDDAGGDGK